MNVHVNRFTRPLRMTAAAAVAALAVGSLSACGSDDSTDLDGAAPVAGDPAEPQDSPAKADGAGETVELNEQVLGAARVGLASDENAPGANLVAVLTRGAVHLIDATSPSRTPRQVEVDDSCDNISTSASGVAVACQDKAIELGADGKQNRQLDVQGKVTTATFLEDGKAVIGKAGEDKAHFFDDSANETGDAIISRDIDEAVLVKPEGRDQRAALIDRGQTSIHDVDVDDGSLNASLRIGQGVGQVASGRADDGVVVASDARQDQMLIYTMNDVVRMHQAIPTDPSPWGVTWDAGRKLAWVASTGTNKLAAYRIDSGSPVKVGDMDTQAKVRGVFDAANGALVMVAEDGSVAIVSPEQVNKNVEAAGNNPDDEYPVRREG